MKLEQPAVPQITEEDVMTTEEASSLKTFQNAMLRGRLPAKVSADEVTAHLARRYQNRSKY